MILGLQAAKSRDREHHSAGLRVPGKKHVLNPESVSRPVIHR
jgi:hypothetical protein